MEYGYAHAAGLKMAALENRAGNMVAPSVKSFQAALAAINLPENLIASDADPQGKQAYPIVTYTWLLCYKRYENEAKLDALKDLLMYCLSEGQRSSARLGYVPLPETKLKTIRKVVMELER